MELLMALFTTNFEDSFWMKVVGGVVIYYVARGEVRKQFTGVTNQLEKIEVALKTFGQKLTDLERAHDSRLTKVEADVVHIKKDLTDLKIKLNP